jgi:TolB-like protein
MKKVYPQISGESSAEVAPLFEGSASKGIQVLTTNHANFADRIVRFGTFEVDLELRELRKRGLNIRIEAKPFKILEMLLEHPGRVITREALREKLWPDTHVGYDQNLNTAISKLRELLGDTAQSSRFIKTLSRLGYRFIAPVVISGHPSLAGKKMLAVLPFENLGADPEQEFFADGLTEEVISHLGQLDPGSLGVIARTTVLRYKKTRKSIAEIAAELKVGCLLAGSVRCEGNRVRVSVHLIEAVEQTHLWSESYNCDLRAMLSAQADVARQVGQALSLELLPEVAAKSLAFDPAAQTLTV